MPLQVRLICKKAGITQALSVEWVAEQLPGVPAPQIVQALQELGVVLQQSGSQGGDTQPQQYGDQSIIPCSEETEAERERADVVGAGQEEQNQIDKSFGAEILLESEEKTGGIEREGAEKENGLGAGWENGLASGDGDDESMVPETQSLITSRSGLIAAWDKASLPGLRACGSRVDDVAFVHSPRDATKAAIAAIDVCELQGDTAEQADDGGRLPLEESIPASGAGDESACRSRAQVEAGTPSTGRASVVGGRYGSHPTPLPPLLLLASVVTRRLHGLATQQGRRAVKAQQPTA